MLDKILTVKPEDELTALRKRCEGCGERVAIRRVAVSLARGHSRFFCSDRCGDGEPLERDLRGFATIMRGWDFRHLDFREILQEKRHDDFLFLDPPYDGTFSGYAAGGFSWKDQLAIVEAVRDHRGPVVAMNANTPRIAVLYRAAGFRIRRVRAPRKVSGDGDRTGTLEMLATRGTDAFNSLEDSTREVAS